MRRFAFRMGTAVFAFVALATTPYAAPVAPRAPAVVFGTATHLQFGQKTGVPRGYFDLCRSGNSVCRITSGRLSADRSGAVELTAELAAQLDDVNTSVNHSIRPVSDPAGKDRWTVGARSGDCEDYAITKKQILLRSGWPSSALVVALARARGQQHAILIARTTEGDFALDNLKDRIVGWNKTGYRYEKVQSPRDIWAWYRL